MKTLGITGGIGSGKTTVCKILEDLGARVFYADAEARRLMEENPALRTDIVDAFGSESYTPLGKVNRAYLARQVFGDEQKLNMLNQLVHPRVLEAFEQAKVLAREDAVPLLVKEAALIYESGGDRQLDAVVVVDAPTDERVRRVTERDQVPSEQVLARMGHQLPPEELRRRADYVIENTGSLEDLRRQVQKLYQRIMASPG